MPNYTPATVNVNNHELHWETDGYYVFGDDQWKNIEFVATMTYRGGVIGIVPRVYADNMYMTMKVQNQEASDGTTKAFVSLSAQETYEEIHLGETIVSPLSQDQDVTFRVEIRGTNYQFYLNSIRLFNIEYAGMSRGRVGLYASSGNGCKNVEVRSAFPEGWSTNVNSVSGAIVDLQELENGNKVIHLNNPNGSMELYIRQSENVTGGQFYTLSFQAEGSGTAKIIELNGINPKTYSLPINSNSWTFHHLSQQLSADCTAVAIQFGTMAGVLKVDEVQFEQKPFATSYIHNDSTTGPSTRGNSLITFPSKNSIRTNEGSLTMWVKPALTYTGSSYKPVLFEFGDTEDAIRLFYDNGQMKLKYGASNEVGVTVSFDANTWYGIVATWSGHRLFISVNNTEQELTGNFSMSGSSDVIRIGHSKSTSLQSFYGVVDETIVYSEILSSEQRQSWYESTESIPDAANMLMRATFNEAIGSFDKSIIEATQAPKYGSPILVEKNDGTPLKKVSFFDFYTGEYRTYNEEQIVYDGISDYLVISYDDVDTQNFKISVRDEDGITYGDPYVLDGRRVYLTLTPEEKQKLKGRPLYVTYQLENSYTVDFNIGVPDSFRVTLGKHDGQPVKVIYEGNDFSDEKLATMVELNPMLNPNHQGFLYITRNVEPVTSFRVRISPEDLPANGGSESLVIVEPLDAYGNFVSHAKLDVSCQRGTIIPAYDPQSILLRDRAGRFLYRYRAPIIYMDQEGAFEVLDTINIVDKETGIGVQAPITLTTLQVMEHVIQPGDIAEKIALTYGTTVEEIAIENGMSVEELKAYISTNVNQPIQIPINYSAKELRKSTDRIHQEMMIVYLLGKVTDYMNQPVKNLPAGLGDILDFNHDGLINIQEVTWLKENEGTSVIQSKYTDLKTWEQTN